MNKQIQNVVTEMIDGINYQQMIGGEIFLNLKRCSNWAWF